MKTTMTISLEKDLKEDFSTFARDIWTNPTNLLNMMMKNTLSTREVRFWKPILDIEVEPFSEEEVKMLQENPRIQENLRKAEKLLANI